MSTTSSDDRADGNGNQSFPQHLNWDTIPVEKISDGIERQMLVGDRMMICRFRFKPFLITPEHGAEVMASLAVDGLREAKVSLTKFLRKPAMTSTKSLSSEAQINYENN